MKISKSRMDIKNYTFFFTKTYRNSPRGFFYCLPEASGRNLPQRRYVQHVPARQRDGRAAPPTLHGPLR